MVVRNIDYRQVLYRLVIVGLLLYVLVPIGVIFATSLTTTEYVTFPPQGIGAQWYTGLLNSPDYQLATFNSVYIAVFASVFATVLGTSAAYAMDRTDPPGKNLLYGMFTSPIILPPIILATGFLTMFAPLDLTATYLGVIIGHAVFIFPFPFILVSKGLAEIDPALEEASMNLGADRIATVRNIVFPLIKANISAGFIFAFVLSLNEYIIAQLVAGFSLTTLPINIFNSLRYSLDPRISSISVLIILVTAVLVIVVDELVGGLW